MTATDPLVVRYLSDEWISAVAQEIATDATIKVAAADHSVSVSQIVTDTPFGDVNLPPCLPRRCGAFQKRCGTI